MILFWAFVVDFIKINVLFFVSGIGSFHSDRRNKNREHFELIDGEYLTNPNPILILFSLQFYDSVKCHSSFFLLNHQKSATLNYEENISLQRVCCVHILRVIRSQAPLLWIISVCACAASSNGYVRPSDGFKMPCLKSCCK